MSLKPLIRKQGLNTQADIAEVDPCVLAFSQDEEYPKHTLPYQLKNCVDQLSNQPTVTISKVEPDDTVQAKEGDLWYQISK